MSSNLENGIIQEKENPRLKDLQAKYSLLNREVTAPQIWTDDHVRPDDLLYFRGDKDADFLLKSVALAGCSRRLLAHEYTS